MSEFLLHDGRKLDFLDNARNADVAILFHHGTPGNSTSWERWIEELAHHDLRAFALSRPGYGESDRQVGRRVVDIQTDLTEFLDEFNIKRFVSVGWSGGGPHSLATALDDRCVGVISLAGVAKYGEPDLDFLAGMGPENIEEFGVASHGEATLREWLKAHAIGMQKVTGEELREEFGGLIGEADKAVLAGSFADDMAAEMRRALLHGFDGWIDDDLAFVADWGFDVGTITVPVKLWQGDDDFMVPHSHSRWLLANIPSAELAFFPGQGHISLGITYQQEIIAQAAKMLLE